MTKTASTTWLRGILLSLLGAGVLACGTEGSSPAKISGPFERVDDPDSIIFLSADSTFFLCDWSSTAAGFYEGHYSYGAADPYLEIVVRGSTYRYRLSGNTWEFDVSLNGVGAGHYHWTEYPAFEDKLLRHCNRVLRSGME